MGWPERLLTLLCTGGIGLFLAYAFLSDLVEGKVRGLGRSAGPVYFSQEPVWFLFTVGMYGVGFAVLAGGFVRALRAPARPRPPDAPEGDPR